MHDPCRVGDTLSWDAQSHGKVQAMQNVYAMWAMWDCMRMPCGPCRTGSGGHARSLGRRGADLRSDGHVSSHIVLGVP